MSDVIFARRFSVSQRDPVGALSIEIARAVHLARRSLGDTAWCESVQRGEALGYDVYDITFKATSRAYHPLQVEQAIRDRINARQP
jgi:hypothetical protein